VSRPRQRGLLGGYAEEVAAAMRRRREVRRPRVRIRVAHAEARVLDDEAPAAGRLLALAREMLDEREEAPHG
jgi:hypothetical protein